MTLIEIVLHYRELVREEGRAAAEKFIGNSCDPQTHWDIRMSVNDDGEFIDAFGKPFNVIDGRE
jgi:hypothetical protein